MQRLVSIIMIFLLMGKLIFTTFWLVYFQLNQREIIRLECENKNRPAMKCNGKCYLAKQLKKAEFELEHKKDRQQQSAQLMKSMEMDMFYLPPINKLIAANPTLLLKIKATSFYTKCLLEGSNLDIFHPPCG